VLKNVKLWHFANNTLNIVKFRAALGLTLFRRGMTAGAADVCKEFS